MDLVEKDILGRKGLNYGRVPASGFRSVWANLDLGNMAVSELMEYLGRKDVPGDGKVEMMWHEVWDEKGVLEKLEEIVMGREPMTDE